MIIIITKMIMIYLLYPHRLNLFCNVTSFPFELIWCVFNFEHFLMLNSSSSPSMQPAPYIQYSVIHGSIQISNTSDGTKPEGCILQLKMKRVKMKSQKGKLIIFFILCLQNVISQSESSGRNIIGGWKEIHLSLFGANRFVAPLRANTGKCICGRIFVLV